MSLSPSAPRVRFAPSPTGALHVGGLRTAIFNYLFAKHHQGTFILRIEDTDRKRYVPQAATHIKESLHWLGMVPDEVVESQAARKDIYLTHAKRLHSEGKAYYAFDTPEALENMRKRLAERGAEHHHYNALVRNEMENEFSLSQEEVSTRLAQGMPAVLRLKVPTQASIHFEDLIRGRIRVAGSTLEDKVLIKADGMPTYHLAHVVDDHLSAISHVIRGEEWLPSTPLHVLIYQALEWEVPQFAHLPLLLKSTGKGKLSKRDAESQGIPIYALGWEQTKGFREVGFHAEALFNFLACLGWQAPKEQSILNPKALIAAFTLEKVSKNGARFDYPKACWYNGQYLRALPPATLVSLLKERYPAACRQLSEETLLAQATLFQERISLLKEVLEKGVFLHKRPTFSQEEGLPAAVQEQAHVLSAYLQASPSTLAPEALKEQFIAQATKQNAPLGKAFRALRYALSKEVNGPDLGEILQWLKGAEIEARIQALLTALPTQ